MIAALLIGALSIGTWGGIKRDAAPVPQPETVQVVDAPPQG